ncbi:MAG: type I polyketide synthase, partial [Methylococcales bacterium]|nr:type I polyketide synthase [Methylococcales bacterium]
MSQLKNNKNIKGTSNKTEEQIAVVGLGCRYPGAKSPRELWQNILAGRVQFREMPDCRLPLDEYYNDDQNAPDKTYGTRAAVIDGYEFDWSGKRIPKSTFESTDIVHWLALDTTLQMLNDTQHGIESLPKEKTAVIIGNTLTGEFTRSKTMRLRWPFVRKSLRATALECGMEEQDLSILEQRMEERFKSVFPPMNEDSLAGGLANTIAGRICNYLDLNGGGYTVDGACSSSLIAIYTAASQLSNKTVDFAIAGGVDISLDPFELIGFAKTGALTKSEMRVYDKRGNGFIPGEGCGIVGLKRLEDAERDGDKIYAVLKGWGISSDGKGGITAPSDSGQSLAIRRALDVAKLDPKDLDFIEGHGTGTAVGDKVEILGIAKTLPNQNKRTCGITSFKSLVGHTKAAAGVGAFIKTVMAVNQRILPPTNGCELPHDEFSKNAQMIYPIQKGKILEENTLLNAGISAMGFGGINSHLIIASGSKVFPHLKSSLAESSLLASKQNTELFIFADSDLLALKIQIEHYIPVVKLASYAELTDISALLAKKYQQLFNDKSQSTTLMRAAVVGSTPYEFLHRLKALAKVIDSQDSTDTNTIHHIDQDKGIWLASNVNDIRLGFLFPGQGSQQINMGRMLFDRYSWAKDIVSYANRCFKEAGEERVIDTLFPASDHLVSDIEKNEAEKLLTNTEITQPALVLCSVLWLKYLEKLGIKPSSVMGHSLGELVAFYAAGSFDEKTLYTLAVMRGKQMAQPPGTSLGAMVSLSCNKAEALSLISSLSRDAQKNLFLANINSEKQTVISGVSIAIDELVSAAETNKTRAVKLHVSNAFHSPMVNKAAEYLAEHSPLQQRSDTLSCSLISSTNGKKVGIDIDLVEHFSQQLITPVNFIAAVNRIKDETDILIEVGAGKVLSHLVENITQEKNYCHPISSSATDDRDLNNLMATLFSVGININWDEFYNQRLVIDFKPASERQFFINPCEKELTATHFSIAPLFSSEMSETLRSVSNVIDIEPQFLQPYLKQRGDFITSVIKSDIKSLSLLPTLGDSPFKEVQKIESLHSISSTLTVIEEKPNLSGNVFNLFVVAIADKTGFEEDSITSNLNMLNDLNLDSIKAGEIISNIALDLGVSEHVDPVDFVDVTVGEIADTLECLLPDNDSDQRKQHLSNDNIINHSPTLLSDSWVRSFSLNVEENPYQPQDQQGAVNFSESLADQSIIIIRASEQETVANDLTPHFIELGAHVDVVLIDELKKQVKTKSYHHYIIICNESSLGFDATSNQLQEMVSFFATIAVNRSEQAEPCLSMTYLQLSDTAHPNRKKGLLSRGAGSFAASIHLENPNIKIRVLDYFSVTSAEKIYQDWLLEMALIQPFNHAILNEKTRLAL